MTGKNPDILINGSLIFQCPYKIGQIKQDCNVSTVWQQTNISGLITKTMNLLLMLCEIQWC